MIGGKLIPLQQVSSLLSAYMLWYQSSLQLVGILALDISAKVLHFTSAALRPASIIQAR
jgi:hypothetical protein